MPAPTSKPPPLKRRATAASPRITHASTALATKIDHHPTKTQPDQRHWYAPASQIMPITRPSPILLLSHEPSLHRIQMNVFQLLPKIPYPPNNRIEITILPKRRFAPARAQNGVTSPTLKTAHDLNQIFIVRMQQEVSMRRHNHIPKQKKIPQRSLQRKCVQNQIAFCSVQRRSIACKIRSNKEKPIAVFNPSKSCHDSCMI